MCDQTKFMVEVFDIFFLRMIIASCLGHRYGSDLSFMPRVLIIVKGHVIKSIYSKKYNLSTKSFQFGKFLKVVLREIKNATAFCKPLL